MAKKREFTPEDIQAICSAYLDEALNPDQIGARYSASRSLIQCTLIKNNIPLRTTAETWALQAANRFNADQTAEMIRLYEEFLPLRVIGKHFKCSPKTVKSPSSACLIHG